MTQHKIVHSTKGQLTEWSPGELSILHLAHARLQGVRNTHWKAREA